MLRCGAVNSPRAISVASGFRNSRRIARNPMSEQVYGSSVDLTPILFKQSRIYYRPRSEGGGILCQSHNAKDGGTLAPSCQQCPHSKFTKNGKPDCTLCFNYLVVLWPQAEVLTFRLKSSALKTGRAWNATMKTMKRPMRLGVYQVSIVNQSSPKGTYFAPIIKLRRFVTKDEFQYASSVYNEMRGRSIMSEESEHP